jgi:fumarate reductase subunit D
MSKQDFMWTTAGAAGVVSAILAALTVWLFLTNPLAVTAAAGRSDTLGVFHAVAGAMYHLAAHVLRYL